MSSADRTAPTNNLPSEFVGAWTLDPGQTTIEFRTKALWGLLAVKGTFKAFEGTAHVTETHVEGALSIDASSVDTGNEKMDEHLRSPDWLDSLAHPRLEYCLQGASFSGDRTVRFDGSFQVRDHARRLRIVGNLMSHTSDCVEIRSEFEVDRRDWGLADTKKGAQTQTHIVLTTRWQRVEL